MAETTDRQTLRPWKKALFWALTLAVVVGVAEATAWVAGSIAFGDRFTRQRLKAYRTAVIEGHGRVSWRPQFIEDEILHPYVGFLPGSRVLNGRYGIAQATPGPAPTDADDQIVIAVIGGSFADQFAEEGLPHLIARLGTLPELRGRAIVSLNTAARGYKQPQQLMTVVYLLALGARFDILINLDGFNEIVLYPTESAAAKVFPAYPRRWHQRVEGILSADALRMMLKRAGIEARRNGLARTFSGAPWSSVNTANLIYLVLDARIEAQLAEADRNLLTAEQRASGPIVATGPRIEFKNDLEMFRYLVDLWRRSSHAIHEVVTGYGVRYYHFLQPNQYVPASKPMGPEEKRDALRLAKVLRPIVETAYPLLQEAGRALATNGVRFQDLSAAYAARPEPLYVDGCCHVSTRGYLIVADHIFDVIRRDVAARGFAPVKPCRRPDGRCP